MGDAPAWELMFYEKPSGQPVVEKFIDSLQNVPRSEEDRQNY